MNEDGGQDREARIAVLAIKVVHTLLFGMILAALFTVVADGIAGRPRRRTGAALAVVVGESMIFLGNRARCPLTQVVERLGDPHGQVTDIFLPRVVADTLPYWSGALLSFAITLNGLHLIGRRGRKAGTPLRSDRRHSGRELVGGLQLPPAAESASDGGEKRRCRDRLRDEDNA